MTAGEVLLDAAAGAPLAPAARAALLTALDTGWADPARPYAAGRRSRALLDGARESVAAALGVRTDEVLFTAGGCAATRLAVDGVRQARRRHGAHVLHSAVEHSCVLHAVEQDATAVPVDRLGRVDPAGFRPPPGTVLGCLIAASHEVGTRQPVAAVAEALGAVPLLLDAGAALTHGPVGEGWSLLSADARAWGGPGGIGVLVVRTGTRWSGPREEAVDVPSAVAAAVSLQEDAAEDARLRALVDRVRAVVPATVPDVEVVGDALDRLPHLVTFSCLYVDGEALLTALSRRGFAVGSGSACTSDTLQPSHVLAAMGVLSQGNVRLSLPRGTRADDVERFLALLPDVVAEVRAAGGATGL